MAGQAVQPQTESMFDVDPRHGSNIDIQDVVGADGGAEA